MIILALDKALKCLIILLICLCTLYSPGQAVAAPPGPVQFTQGILEIPTYSFSHSETAAPHFKSIENIGHYPYTGLEWESRADKPLPVKYEVLRLENEYLRVEFIPELGGRIYSAYDKVAKRDLFYHPTVIKPGRYNQRGGWPVGNLELYGPFDAHMLTWPGEPWVWALTRQPNGSATVVLSHIDHFFRNKISLEVALYPGQAYVEVTIRLHNRNLVPNRYLIWTNAGVAVSEGSRFVYPMTQTIGHDSSALGHWPMINGVDMTWNKNNVNMLGVFGLDIFDDFMSIYDYKNDIGTICHTNRLLARGMKTWTFGSGPTALRQMATYTDKDGLYMETQSGRFIWDGNYEFIDPGQSDGWTERWFGAGGLGGLTSATSEVAIRLDVPASFPGKAVLAATATASYPDARLELYAGDQLVWKANSGLSHGGTYRSEIPLAEESRGKILNLKILSQAGKSLLDYTQYPDGSHPNAVYASDSIPRKFGAPDTLSAEEAYQKGLGHEKFGQLSDAEAAYQLALSKDPLFSLPNLRLGLMALEGFQPEEAREYFEKVLERDPTNGDAHYFLGVIHTQAGRRLEARRHFYRLLPNSNKFVLRDYGLALVDLQEEKKAEALTKVSAAAAAAPLDLEIRQAHAYLLRATGKGMEATRERSVILKMDPTNAFVRMEDNLASPPPSPSATKDLASRLDHTCAGHAQGYLELATEYMRLSAWKEAGQVMDSGIRAAQAKGQPPNPLLHYYRAFAAVQMKDTVKLKADLQIAGKQDLQLEIFPFRREDEPVFKAALAAAPADANAATLLGDLLYSRQRKSEAINLWRQAVAANPRHFNALRDLGLALLMEGKQQEGLGYLSRASLQNPEHLATTTLLANTYARVGDAEAARRTFERALAKRPNSDPLIERLASVEAQMGNYQRALELLNNHTFGATHQAYGLLHLYRAIRLGLALEESRQGHSAQALEHVHAAMQPPGNLGVDDFASVKSARLLVHEALLQSAAGKDPEATRAWTEAANVKDDDVEAEGLFREIALNKIGEKEKPEKWIREFLPVNEQRKSDNARDLRTHAFGLAATYDAFIGDGEQAKKDFQRALEIDQSYLYARVGLAWLDAGLYKGLR
jgi:tetratricopeptide (TPR) repeat protein